MDNADIATAHTTQQPVMTGAEFAFYRPQLPPVPSDCIPSARLRPATVSWRNGVVIRSPNWLGDVMMALPAVYQIKQQIPFPCGLFVVCPAGLAPLWECLPWVNRVIPFTGARVTGQAAFLVRSLSAGVGVVLPNSFGSALDLYRRRIPMRVGRRGRGRSLLLTHTLPALPQARKHGTYHQAYDYLELLSLLGPVSTDLRYPPPLVPKAAEIAAKLGMAPTADGPGWLILAPGAAYGPAKQWPVRHFRAVAEWWVKQGGRVTTVGAVREEADCAAVSTGLAGSLNLAGKTSLRELIAVLQNARLVIANDSGVMHLAAGLGKPGVALFGCTNPVATGPVGGTWVVLHEKMACSPCFQRSCRHTGANCRGLQQLAPETACAALEYLLKS